MNIICKDNDFYRLYYYIINAEAYEFLFLGRPVVCDVFIKEENETYYKLKKTLENQKFVQYEIHYKASVKANELMKLNYDEKLVYDCDIETCIRKKILEHFNKYTENVPSKEQLLAFLKEKYFIKII